MGTFVRTQIEYLKRAGIEVELLLLRGRIQKLVYLQAPFELRRRLSGSSIDLIHAHYGYAGIIARTQWQVPVVVSFCGDDLLGTVNADGRQTLLGKFAVASSRFLSAHVDAVIVKSKQMGCKIKRRDVHVIPNEVDLDVFRPMEKMQARTALGLDVSKKYLLFAANPQIPVKRFPLAKSVADKLNSDYDSVELLTVYKEPQARLALYMNACDALLFTSYQEGSPNIVKQAMACNLPIISTDVGDVREIMGDTKGCYVCDPVANEFAAAVSQCLRTGLRTQGYQSLRHLAGPLVAQRVIAVYEHVLKNRQRPLSNHSEGKALAARI